MRLLFEIVTNAIATVYFDGSLCHPVDPTFPTFKQKRRASCAAYIRFGDDSQEILGGRILSGCSSSTTSAEVEYEALILGLEGLKQHWLKDTLPVTTETAFYPVVVLGDCKTVIQQMNGGSRPRKMEPLYRRASQAAEDIQTLHPHVQISFQHISRTQNIMSDRLCSTILAEKQYRDDQAAILALSSLSSNAAYLEFLNSYLDKESNALKYSRRPAVYRYLSKLASRSKEWNTLIEIGERWSREIQDVWPRHSERRDELFVEAMTIQLAGLEAVGNQKELLYLQRKYQYLLSQHAPISGKVGRELSQSSLAGDLGIVPRELEFSSCDCPPLIQKWMQVAAGTSVWTNAYAYWTNGVVSQVVHE